MKSYNFYCKHINSRDYNILLQFAENIKAEKNKVSKLLFDYYLEDIFFHTLSKYNFYTVMNSYRTINDATAYQQSCFQVYTQYRILLDNLQYKYNKNLSTEDNQLYKFLFNFRFNNMNDLINYLSKNKDNKEIIDRLDDNLFNTIHNLQLNQLQTLKPICFKSLTFNTNNVLTGPTNMINLIHQSHYNAVIKIKIPNQKLIYLPTKYNKIYHKELDDFSHSVRFKYRNKVKTKDIQQTIYNYSIKFLNNKKIKIIMCKNLDDSYEFTDIIPNNTIGVDVNTKHNMFAISHGNDRNNIFITADQTLITKEQKLQHYLARLQYNKAKNHNSKKHGKHVRRRENKQECRRIFHQNQKSKELINYCKQHNIKNIFMEDLNLQTKGHKDKEGNNHKHIEKAIHINDLKNSIQRIGNKYGLQVHLVNARYTSQTCHMCGHIDKKNRMKQEEFECTHCGYIANADSHSALNIRERGVNEYLRNQLEYYDKKEKRYKGKSYKKIQVYLKTYKHYVNM